MEFAKAGEAAEGDWLIAESQSAGRGRRGRQWESPVGNLYASTVVSLRPGDPAAPTLSFVAAWALWSAAGVSTASFKWPNDIIVGDRKLAGILLERTEDLVIVGFGLNVESPPNLPDRMTTCVREWRSDTFDLQRLFDDLQGLFASNLERWRAQGFSIFRRLWESEGPIRGEHLKVSLGNGMLVEGAYSGLADDGALKLVLASGREELVHAGEVEL